MMLLLRNVEKPGTKKDWVGRGRFGKKKLSPEKSRKSDLAPAKRRKLFAAMAESWDLRRNETSDCTEWRSTFDGPRINAGDRPSSYAYQSCSVFQAGVNCDRVLLGKELEPSTSLSTAI